MLKLTKNKILKLDNDKNKIWITSKTKDGIMKIYPIKK